MALPKQRHTRHRRDRARKFHALKPIATVTCPKCSSPMTPHRACGTCGEYRGKAVLNVAPKLKTASATKAA